FRSDRSVRFRRYGSTTATEIAASSSGRASTWGRTRSSPRAIAFASARVTSTFHPTGPYTWIAPDARLSHPLPSLSGDAHASRSRSRTSCGISTSPIAGTVNPPSARHHRPVEDGDEVVEDHRHPPASLRERPAGRGPAPVVVPPGVAQVGPALLLG